MNEKIKRIVDSYDPKLDNLYDIIEEMIDDGVFNNKEELQTILQQAQLECAIKKKKYDDEQEQLMQEYLKQEAIEQAKRQNEQEQLRAKQHDFNISEVNKKHKQDSEYISWWENVLNSQEQEAERIAQQEETQRLHERKLSYIREDNSISSLSGILKTLGINVPDKLIRDSKSYERSKLRFDELSDENGNARADLTEAETNERKSLEETMAATENAYKLLKKLPPEIGTTVAVLGSLAVVIAEMNKLGQESIDTFKEINESLAVTGETSYGISKIATIQYEADSNWDKIKKDLESLFAPVTAILSSISLGISEIVVKATDFISYNGDDYTSQYTDWYTSRLAGQEGLTESGILGNLAVYETAFKNQGADNMTASNMAVMLHNSVINSDVYKGLSGEGREKMFESVLDAVVSGEAMSQYGINTSDNVLTGYLAEQGIDNVNIKISDLMNSYYRLQLVQDELGADSNDVMSKQISDWGKLGAEIDNSKGKLLSFDKELVLGGYDSAIPEVNMPVVEDTYGNIFGGTGGLNELQLTQEELSNIKQDYEGIVDIETEVDAIIVRYLNNLGYTEQQIKQVFEAWKENPEGLKNHLEQIGLTKDQVIELENAILHASGVADDQISDIIKDIKDTTKEAENLESAFDGVSEKIGKTKITWNEFIETFKTDIDNIKNNPLLSGIVSFLIGGLGGVVANNISQKLQDKLEGMSNNEKLESLNNLFSGTSLVTNLMTTAINPVLGIGRSIITNKISNIITDAKNKETSKSEIHVHMEGTNILDSEDRVTELAYRVMDIYDREKQYSGGVY